MSMRPRLAITAAAALLIAGIPLFFLAGAVIWLKVFSGFMVGIGGTRLIVLARRSERAMGETPS